MVGEWKRSCICDFEQDFAWSGVVNNGRIALEERNELEPRLCAMYHV
jgi:hypothetical protein